MKELEQKIERGLTLISQFSHDPGGGLSRLLYKEDWVKTQRFIAETMEKKGFEQEFDPVGNLFITFRGEEPSTILVGSHIDTVVNGGQLDGQFGVLAGLIAIEILRDQYGTPQKTIQVVSMAEEEGSRFPYTFWGSKNIVGTPSRQEVAALEDVDGINFTAAMHRAGFDFKPEDSQPRKDIEKYLEIHIEQGGILEREGQKIGVVTDIVGQRRFTFKLVGQANHAGTTPMSYRRDALVAAAAMIVAIDKLARQYGDPMVATVGQIEVVPNTSNVVPGDCEFTLDMRQTKKSSLDSFEMELLTHLQQIAEEYEVDLSHNKYMDAAPVPLDAELKELIQNYCEREGIRYRVMHSGAGHDAQIFAPHVPTGLIFVPSINGVSHSPEESTDLADLAEGVRVLLGVLHELAY